MRCFLCNEGKGVHRLELMTNYITQVGLVCKECFEMVTFRKETL